MENYLMVLKYQENLYEMMIFTAPARTYNRKSRIKCKTVKQSLLEEVK